MSWASERRAMYLSIVLVAVVIALGALGYWFFYDKPTCFDGKQNGGEDGVDCGGSCELVCPFQTGEPIVLWSRFFEIAPGVYNAVAVIENPNVSAEADNVAYSFKFRDARGVLILEKTGTADIPQGTRFAVFESSVTTGGRAPERIFFEFTESPEWRRGGEMIELLVRDSVLTGVDDTPRLSAQLVNPTLETARDIEVVAVVSDTSGNALAASRTVVDLLSPEESAPLVFTWPEAFDGTVGPIEFFVQMPSVR